MDDSLQSAHLTVTTPHGEIQGLRARAEWNVPAGSSFTQAQSKPTVMSTSPSECNTLKATRIISW
ncbi:MAG TPA: hypothetical protein VN207_11040 [Ktedonobacteraceae bacterium]|nr:hypothetical protein [Ktedonobacteraceae bacterium]